MKYLTDIIQNAHRKAVTKQYLTATLILTALNAAFWSLADFGDLVPPSEGTIKERLFFFLITEGGPLSFLYLDWFNVFWTAPLIIVTIAILAWSLLSVENTLARALAYLAIIFWFFWGFAVAGLRIT